MLWQVFIYFLVLGCTAFGGPVAHIGYFREAFVVNKKWLTEQQFAEYLSLSQFLPGPGSSQLGFMIGYHRAGLLGAIFAFVGFTLPSVVIMLAAVFGMAFISGGAWAVQALQGLAFIVVAHSLWVMFTNLCPDARRKAMALVMLLGLWVFPALNLWLIIPAGFAGVWLIKPDVKTQEKQAVNNTDKWRSGLYGLLFLGLLAAAMWIDKSTQSLWGLLAIFYQAGALVFGGGHVVLPLLEQPLMAGNWLPYEDFLMAYGMAQAIAGPMFSLSAFIGGAVGSELGVVATGLLSVLALFLPGFLLVLAVLPFWRSMASNKAVAAAIAGVNTAVVALLAAAFLGPVTTHAFSSWPMAVLLLAGVLIRFYWHWSIMYLLACTAVGSFLLAQLANIGF